VTSPSSSVLLSRFSSAAGSFSSGKAVIAAAGSNVAPVSDAQNHCDIGAFGFAAAGAAGARILATAATRKMVRAFAPVVVSLVMVPLPLFLQKPEPQFFSRSLGRKIISRQQIVAG